MNRIFLLTALLLGTASANAQVYQRGTLLYGDLTFNRQANEDISNGTTTSKASVIRWNVGPGIGHQFGRSTIGVNFSWGQTAFMYQEPSLDPLTENRYTAGVFYRYTRSIMKTPMFWYGQATGKYLGGYTTSTNKPAFDQYTGLSIDLVPALGVYVKKGIALNFSIGGVDFTRVVSEVTPSGIVPPNTELKRTDEHVNVTLGKTFNVGVSVNFGSVPFGASKKIKAEEEED